MGISIVGALQRLPVQVPVCALGLGFHCNLVRAAPRRRPRPCGLCPGAVQVMSLARGETYVDVLQGSTRGGMLYSTPGMPPVGTASRARLWMELRAVMGPGSALTWLLRPQWGAAQHGTAGQYKKAA